MDTAVLTALVAVGGTVAGSLATSIPTYLISRHAERNSRTERARAERMNACVEVTTALDALQRFAREVCMGRKHHHQEYAEALTSAEQALARLRLVIPMGPNGRLPGLAQMAIRDSVIAAQLPETANATEYSSALSNSTFAVMRRPEPTRAGPPGFLGLWLIGAM